jgi:hypothetical protein
MPEAEQTGGLPSDVTDESGGGITCLHSAAGDLRGLNYGVDRAKPDGVRRFKRTCRQLQGQRQ